MAARQGDDRVTRFFAKAAEAVAEVGQGAVADIRHKLVEEPWFGRAVTAEPVISLSEQAGWSVPAGDTPEKRWNELCDRLAKERSQHVEHDKEREHDPDFEP
jgi:hypothetical protein